MSVAKQLMRTLLAQRAALGYAAEIRHQAHHQTAKVFVSQIRYRVDVNTLQRVDGISQLQMNDRGCQSTAIHSSSTIRNRATGSFIMIDDATHNTVAAGMIV